jgi:phospholipid/cholesterol/gamma-HCH transport system substrate-binding protein
VARKLRPFFGEFRKASRDLVPTVRRLDAIVKRKRKDNDLVELTRLQVPLERKAIGTGSPDCGGNPATDFETAADDDFDQGAFGESVCSLRNGLPQLAFFRPYTPELVGWFNDYAFSGQYDANGAFGRQAPVLNTFSFSTPGFPQIFGPAQTPEEQLAAMEVDNLQRCPGSNERDPGDGSTPFGPSDGGPDCDESQVPPGP